MLTVWNIEVSIPTVDFKEHEATCGDWASARAYLFHRFEKHGYNLINVIHYTRAVFYTFEHESRGTTAYVACTEDTLHTTETVKDL